MNYTQIPITDSYDKQMLEVHPDTVVTRYLGEYKLTYPLDIANRLTLYKTINSLEYRVKVLEASDKSSTKSINDLDNYINEYEKKTNNAIIKLTDETNDLSRALNFETSDIYDSIREIKDKMKHNYEDETFEFVGSDCVLFVYKDSHIPIPKKCADSVKALINIRIENHNQDIVHHQKLINKKDKKYDDLLERYNTLIDEYNELLEDD